MTNPLGSLGLPSSASPLLREHGRRLVPFIASGVAGVITTFAGTILLYHLLHLPLWLGSGLAIQAAILVTFSINSMVTWSDRPARSQLRRFITFEAVSLVGMAINEAALLSSVNLLHVFYLEGLLLGSGLAAIWNYLVNNSLTFAAE